MAEKASTEFGNNRDTLIAEYSIAHENWKFLQGLRFAVIAFAATTLAALAGAFQVTAVGILKVPAEGLGKPALYFICVLGIVSLIAILVLERRLRWLYAACSARAREIEVGLGMPAGVYEKLHRVPRGVGKITYSHLIYAVYFLILIAWGYLFVVSSQM